MTKEKSARPCDILIESRRLKNNNTSDERYEICLSCDHFINLTKSCSKCGCFMTIKTKLEHASCPLGKW